MYPYPIKHRSIPMSRPRADGARVRRKEKPGALRRLFQAAIRNWQRRRMIAAFDAMDDRLLHDIGIYRGDIRHVVNALSDRELGMTPVSPRTVKAGRSQADPVRRGVVNA